MNTPRPLAVLLLCLAGSGSLTATTLAAAAAAPPAAEAPPSDRDGPSGQPHCHGPRDGGRDDMGPRHGRGEHGRGPEGAPVLQLLRGLDLSQAQRDKIHESMEKNREPHRELTARRFALHEAFADLDPTAPDYRKKADKLAQDAAGLAQETLRFDARVTAELVAQLSPEQAKTLQSKLAERRERQQQRREHRHDDEGHF